MQTCFREDEPCRELRSAELSSTGARAIARAGSPVRRCGGCRSSGDRTPIYIAGLAEWDPALQGKSLELTGLLKERAARVRCFAAGAAARP
jgi:hypothetical protein